MRAYLPALLATALICAFAGAVVGNTLAQSDPVAERPIQTERRVNPGLAPPMPCVGGRVGACCDLPDLTYVPRCQEWLPKYERWRKAFDAYHRG